MSFQGAEASMKPLELDAARQMQSFRLARRVANRPLAVVAIMVIVIVYTAGILAPWIAPYSFSKTDLADRFAGPSSEHILGTDRLGRDVLSRILRPRARHASHALTSTFAAAVAFLFAVGFAQFIAGPVRTVSTASDHRMVVADVLMK